LFNRRSERIATSTPAANSTTTTRYSIHGLWLFLAYLYVNCGLSGTLSIPEWQAAQVRLVFSLVAADRLGRTNNLATSDHNVLLLKSQRKEISKNHF